MSKWALVGAWVVVALIASTVAWQIVSAADAQVSDRPDAPLQVAAPVVSTPDLTTTTGGGLPSTTGSSTSEATLGGGTAVTSSTTPGSSSTTATSTTVTPSSSTTSSESWKVETIHTGGGSVVISYRSGEVVYNSAVPLPGFSVELKKAGPPEVEVEFESEQAKYEVKAKWSDGRLTVETDEGEEEGED